MHFNSVYTNFVEQISSLYFYLQQNPYIYAYIVSLITQMLNKTFFDRVSVKRYVLVISEI